jgi:Icc-related predicted phosphoesterase
MIPCLFASDLHGKMERYRKLLQIIESEKPEAVFLGGDLFPSGLAPWQGPDSAGVSFLDGFLFPEMAKLRDVLGTDFPLVLVILGNDDMRAEEPAILEGEERGFWTYLHGRKAIIQEFEAFGYSFVPPTPFPWKDWERYDVSRYVPPGSVSPEEGWRTVEVESGWIRYGNIKKDLEELTGTADLTRTIVLFHTPPHDTLLDRAALDGRFVDHVPLDLHVGSIAVRRFIETRQPLLTLHGHIHESARLTGSWRDVIGRTHLFSAAHDGPELALIRFDLEHLDGASRVLL